MAGVGLELQKLQKNKSYLGFFKVFSYALALSVGPWLATMVTVGLISLIGIYERLTPAMVFLTTTIMYVFAGSLLVTGPLFMMFSRFLADQGFMGRPDQRRSLLIIQIVVILASFLVGIVCIPYFLPLSMGNSRLYQTMTLLLLVSLCGVWSIVAYMDFAKRFATSFYLFLFGSCLSVIIAYALRKNGVSGLITGYAIGNTLTYALLLGVALKKPEKSSPDQKTTAAMLFNALKNFAVFGWIGFLYNTGIWIDKFAMWIMAGEIVSGTRMKILPPYDIATFMAYLIMIPAVAYFLVILETEFYTDYRAYLEKIESGTLREVEESRLSLVKNVRRHLNHLFEFEFVIAVICFILGSYALRRMALSETTVTFFQILVVAAFLQVFFWIHLILLLYFEFRNKVLLLVTFFVASNLFFTWLNFQSNSIPYGWGYVASALTSTILAWVTLRHGLQHLQRHIFFIHSSVPAN